MRQVDHPYNPLNLPKKVVLYDEESEIESEISYLYDANGVKMEKITKQEHQVIKKVNYQGVFQYTDEEMDFIHTAEGYTKVTHNEENIPYYNYVFNYTDHLGNVRVSWTQNPEAPEELVIIDDNHYYPFGLRHKGYQSHPQVHYWATSFQQVALTTVSSLYPESYKYKFGGKELQTEFGVEMYDFGMRNYDPALGRWMNIDPLAEEAPDWSPYNYTFNNPVRYIDPDGRFPIDPTIIGLYISSKINQFRSNTAAAVKEGKASAGNQITAAITGQQQTNAQIGATGISVDAPRDVATISQSAETIANETGSITKDVTRDVANTMEVVGDGMVIVAPLTGPAAPVVASCGATISTCGTVINASLDVMEGDYESAVERGVTEVTTGGISKLAKQVSGADETAGRIIDSQITLIENIDENKEEENP